VSFIKHTNTTIKESKVQTNKPEYDMIMLR